MWSSCDHTYKSHMWSCDLALLHGKYTAAEAADIRYAWMNACMVFEWDTQLHMKALQLCFIQISYV